MILAVLQARCSSRRLPGKVLEPILGEAMILRHIERIQRSALIDTLVVATSIEPSDDVLVDTLEHAHILVRRGPLDDVASRFSLVIDEFKPEYVVRLTADCPLADWGVIDQVISETVSSGADYGSNATVRTFPDGLDVECFRAESFRALRETPLTAHESEHVTLAFSSRHDEFSRCNVVNSSDESHLRWTVDYPEDLDFVRAVFAELYPKNADFRMNDIFELIQCREDISRINAMHSTIKT